jgi:NAD(P)-dependent dehydrogenase (short-subunit alcohol dehydrogenase family)
MPQPKEPGVAVVLGGGNGIGEAICMVMAGEGWRIAVADVDGARAELVAGEVGGRAFTADVTDAAALTTVADAAKAAMINMTQSLAGEWGRSGVRVNAVSPGVTLVPRIIARRKAGARYAGDPADITALGRCVEPSEVAEAVAFLSSARASAITGVNLPVDCGWLVGAGWAMYGGARPKRNPP